MTAKDVPSDPQPKLNSPAEEDVEPEDDHSDIERLSRPEQQQRTLTHLQDYVCNTHIDSQPREPIEVGCVEWFDTSENKFLPCGFFPFPVDVEERNRFELACRYEIHVGWFGLVTNHYIPLARLIYPPEAFRRTNTVNIYRPMMEQQQTYKTDVAANKQEKREKTKQRTKTHSSSHHSSKRRNKRETDHHGKSSSLEPTLTEGQPTRLVDCEPEKELVARETDKEVTTYPTAKESEDLKVFAVYNSAEPGGS